MAAVFPSSRASWKSAPSSGGALDLKAFVQTEVGRFEERDVPAPKPAAGEVVLKVLAAVTCGTDLKLLARGHARVPLPVTMGHELCGEVIAVGDGVDPAWLGARVVPGISGPCGECRECREGFSNLCGLGHSDRTWGAFADRVRVPASVVASNLHRVPPGLHFSTLSRRYFTAGGGWGRWRWAPGCSCSAPALSPVCGLGRLRAKACDA